jgi:glycosyltransferase involved in cell wall biosynthesis
MTSQSGQDCEEGSTAGEEPIPPLCRKILLFIGTDTIALSSFKPLLQVLGACAHELVVVTRSSGRLAEIEALGARTIDFGDRRLSANPAGTAASVWQLARIIEAEEPDVLHLVGSRSIVMGGLALRLQGGPHVVLHVTGMGPLGVVTGHVSRIARNAALRLAASMLKDPASYLLAETPTDLALLRADGVDPGPRFAILGGAGVDPQEFAALPPAGNAAPVAALIGRMTKGNGVDVLMQACDRVAGRGMALAVELCGESEPGDPDAIDAQALDEWAERGGGTWRPDIADVREVWRRADICVLPARHGGGMPTALRRRRPRPIICASRTPTATSSSCGSRSICMRATSAESTSTVSVMRCRRSSGSHAAGAIACSLAPVCTSAPLAALSAASTSSSTSVQDASLGTGMAARTSLLLVTCAALVAAGFRHPDSRSAIAAAVMPNAGALAVPLMAASVSLCAFRLTLSMPSGDSSMRTQPRLSSPSSSRRKAP